MKTASQTELSAIIGLSTRQIRNLEREGLPCSMERKRKAYPLPEAVVWWKDREVARALEPYSHTDLEEERRRWMSAKAGKAEIELSNLRGELIPLDEVSGLLRESLEVTAATLKSAPALTAPFLAKAASITTRSARLILEDMVEVVKTQIRTEIHRY